MAEKQVNTFQTTKERYDWERKQWWYPLKQIKNLPFRLWNRLEYIPRQVKWFIQRGIRGYSDFNVWEMHNHLSEVILNMLKQLQIIQHGYPATNDKDGKKTYNKKRWNKILNEMIVGFELLNRDKISYTSKEELKIKEAFELLHKYWFCLWD